MKLAMPTVMIGTLIFINIQKVKKKKMNTTSIVDIMFSNILFKPNISLIILWLIIKLLLLLLLESLPKIDKKLITSIKINQDVTLKSIIIGWTTPFKKNFIKNIANINI